jgi:hypothetical protein
MQATNRDWKFPKQMLASQFEMTKDGDGADRPTGSSTRTVKTTLLGSSDDPRRRFESVVQQQRTQRMARFDPSP